MKLATYRDGSRDGQLVVVSRDGTQAHFATGIATRLQQVLDDWNFLSPQLEDLYLALNQGKARHAFAFESRRCLAPLPRTYQWVYEDGSGGLRHGGGDVFLGPADAARFTDDAQQIDGCAGFAAFTGDLAAGAAPEQALECIRLLTLAVRWTAGDPGNKALETTAAADPPAAFAAIAVTPDELGSAWSSGRVQLRLRIAVAGRTAAGIDAAAVGAPFAELISKLARTRPLCAGSVVASGLARSGGFAALATESSAVAVESATAQAPGLDFGDTVLVEAHGADGANVFGAIEQRIGRWSEPVVPD